MNKVVGIVFKIELYQRIQNAAKSMSLAVVPFIRMAITEKLDKMGK